MDINKTIKRIFRENIFAIIFWILVYLGTFINFNHIIFPEESFMSAFRYSPLYRIYVYPIFLMILAYLAYRYFKSVSVENKNERYTIYAINLFLAVLINIIAAAK
ncbi:MAG: hypothetical protein LBC07_01255 [Elusimicrobiota bacterium]|jgi:uncharacterized membrane protein|nr:hypothetical protein [Elusimicrobiota bacterium]